MPHGARARRLALSSRGYSSSKSGWGAKLRLEKLEEDSWRIFKCSGISLRLVNISPSDKLSVASHKIIEIWHMLVS